MTRVASPFQPRAVVHIELTEPIPPFPVPVDEHAVLPSSLVVATIHGRPVGTLPVTAPAGGLEPADAAARIWRELGPAIRSHLAADGLQAPQSLPADGLGRLADPPCWAGGPDDSEAPRISVIIATKDRTEALRECLRTTLEIDYPDFEIVVVDNGASSSATADMVRETFGHDPRIVYVSERRAGTSIARNLGVGVASGDIVAFTDDDVVVHRNWLRAIARAFWLHENVDCVTGLVVPARLTQQPQQWFEEYGGFNKGYEARVYGRKRLRGYTLLYPYTAGAFGSGNNAAFRKEALLRTGGFDTNLGPGTPARAGEDLDAFLAVALSGRGIAYEPGAIISHDHRSDYDGLKRQIFNYGVGLTAIFTKWALRHPSYALDIARRLPLGIWVVLSPRSAKNRKKSADYPPELGLAEIRGMLLGPFAYLMSLLTASGRR